ncbi:MAG: alpha/beta hydrolase [Desulfatiglandales bacterium]
MEVTIRGTKINIETAGRRKGDRPALVFVHGAGGDASLWGSQEKRLREETVLYRVELPGHGGSGGGGETEIRSYAGWVRQVLEDVLGEMPYIIAGHSMGGAIALDMAIEGNGGPAGMVLVATGAKLGVTPVIFRLLEEDVEGFLTTIDRAALGPGAPPDVRDTVVEGLRRCPPSVVHGDFTACSRFDVRERLGEIRIPTLVVCGEEDHLTPARYSEFLARNIAGARLEIVPGAGHMVMLESPEIVNRAIEGFLKETGFPGSGDSKRKTAQSKEGNSRSPGTGA